jgi:CheY-like chemotaxis protein
VSISTAQSLLTTRVRSRNDPNDGCPPAASTGAPRHGVVKYMALVTDIKLKGPMKGWEVARLVRQIDPAFPIVCMTGAAAGEWARKTCRTAFC